MTLSLDDRFFVSSGSVTGREHLRLGRNNQDARALIRREDRIVAVVADGCSQGALSEAGAILGTRWLAAWLARHGGPVDTLPEALGAALDAYLCTVLAPLEALGVPREAAVSELLLFGFLAVVIDPEQTVITGQGDGLFVLNGVKTRLEPPVDNAPQYPAYRLLHADRLLAGATGSGPTLHASFPTSRLQHLALATDGAAALELPLWLEDPLLARNRAHLQRRLNLAAPDLFDDTTVTCIVAR